MCVVCLFIIIIIVFFGLVEMLFFNSPLRLLISLFRQILAVKPNKLAYKGKL